MQSSRILNAICAHFHWFDSGWPLQYGSHVEDPFGVFWRIDVGTFL